MKESKEFECVREYDLKATSRMFFRSGRHARPYARYRGLPEEGFARFIAMKYVPLPGSEQEKLYIAALEDDGLLVRLPDDDQGQEQAA
jgi:hypothetical protein